MAAGLTPEDAYQLLQSGSPLDGNGFYVLGTIARLAANESTIGKSRDLLIRLLERRDTLDQAEGPLLESLVSRLGLYPYLRDTSALSAAEQLAFEYHRPESLEHENFVFHAIQQEVFHRLMTGGSVVLSAPTSFGKSAIVDALVASQRWDQIAIIVPTLALIDETRRRLARFSDRFKINTFPNQSAEDQTIFIMTQERLLEIDPFPNVGLFIIDEFYKLDAETDLERSALLNIAWDRLHRTGAQYYLTGPNVTGLAEALPEQLRESLLVSDFNTVAVDVVDVRDDRDERSRVISVCQENLGQTLLYCRTPQRAREVSQWLLEGGLGEASGQSSIAGEWIANNYDSDWIVGKCIAHGIGVHNARVPRALLHHIVRLFNSGSLRFLVCTSTLIEGVNTSAQNVLIVDNVLNRQALDYFTFSNIRGRAGRMFRHFVGRVFIFSDAPKPTQTTIDIPIASQSSRASIATLLQLPERDLTKESLERLTPYLGQDRLNLHVLKANKGIDPDRQLAVASTISEDPQTWNRRLAWSGIPTYEQTVAVCQLILDHLVAPQQRGPVNSRSLATRLNVIRRERGSIPAMVTAQLPYSDSRDEAVEDVLSFLRNWAGHIFPRSLMVIERIQADLFARYDLPVGNYAHYAQIVQNLFLPPNFVTLEEYGLPTVVAMKLRDIGLTGESLDELLTRLRAVAANPLVNELLDPFEQEMLGDVVAGLGPAMRIN